MVHEIWINNSHGSLAWLRMDYKYGRSFWQLLVEAMRIVDFSPCFKLEEAVIDLQNNFIVKVNNIYDWLFIMYHSVRLFMYTCQELYMSILYRHTIQ